MVSGRRQQVYDDDVEKERARLFELLAKIGHITNQMTRQVNMVADLVAELVTLAPSPWQWVNDLEDETADDDGP